MSYSARRRQRRQRGSGLIKYVLFGVAFVVLLGLGAAAAGAEWVLHTADEGPPITALKQKDLGALSTVYAADGTRLGFISAVDLRQPVASADIPEVMKQATVAIEDQRFYKHHGVDYEGLARAAAKNILSKQTMQGGSTLTMQLVRNLYTSNFVRSGLAGIKRKLREARLATELEKIHDKNWILSTYINSAPYGTYGGQSAIGVGAAAKLYFNKSAKDLSLTEAAMLAGMPQAPSEYSPVSAPGPTRQRRNEVLAKMAQLGMISAATARRAEAKDLGLHMEDYYGKKRESFFFDYIQNELVKQYGLETVTRGGLKVYTTIDLKKQQLARAAIESQLGGAGPSSAVVSIDPSSGDIVAMASSADYGQSQYNLAAQGQRQPGSTFKVVTLLTALREGVNPDTTKYDSHSPTVVDRPDCGGSADPWTVKTYGGESNGVITLHKATLLSDNSVYAQLASDLGPDKVDETARMLGITATLQGYCAETLGGLKYGVSPLEMANAYATIASGGYRNRPRAIRKVVIPGHKHNKLPKRWRVHRVKAFDDGVTYEATKILEDNIKSGTGTAAAIGCPAGGKTGTTDNNTDAWFDGFTPKLATAVWVGYPNKHIFMNTEFHGGPVDGGTFPALIWSAYMKSAVGGYCGDFPKPKVPFVSKPFHGYYATSGRGKGDSGSSGGDQSGLTGTDNGTGTTTDNGGGSQDQATTSPDTTSTGGDTTAGGGGGGGGNGGGSGNGGGGATGGATPGAGTGAASPGTTTGTGAANPDQYQSGTQ